MCARQTDIRRPPTIVHDDDRLRPSAPSTRSRSPVIVHRGRSYRGAFAGALVRADGTILITRRPNPQLTPLPRSIADRPRSRRCGFCHFRDTTPLRGRSSFVHTWRHRRKGLPLPIPRTSDARFLRNIPMSWITFYLAWNANSFAQYCRTRRCILTKSLYTLLVTKINVNQCKSSESQF